MLSMKNSSGLPALLKRQAAAGGGSLLPLSHLSACLFPFISVSSFEKEQAWQAWAGRGWEADRQWACDMAGILLKGPACYHLPPKTRQIHSPLRQRLRQARGWASCLEVFAGKKKRTLGISPA